MQDKAPVNIFDATGVSPTPTGGRNIFQSAGVSPEQTDTSSGAPWGVRFGGALKTTPEGELNYYKELFGGSNVMTVGSDIYVRPDPSLVSDDLKPFASEHKDEWVKADESGFSWKDVTADTIGGATSLVTEGAVAGIGAMTGGATGGWLGSGAGAAAVPWVRQLQSSIVPGDDGKTVSDLAQDSLTHAGWALAFQGVVNVGAKIFDTFFRPSNYLARAYKRRRGTEIQREGEELSEWAGEPLTPGQESGSRTVLAREGVAAQSPQSSDIIHDKFVRQVDAALTKFDRMAAGLGPEVDAFHVGQRLHNAFYGAVDAAINLRQVEGRRAFQAVDNVIKDLGQGAALIPIENTKQVLRDEIAKASARGTGSAQKKLAKDLQKLLDELGDDPMTTTEMQNLLHNWGKAASGQADQFKNLDKAAQKRHAKRIFGTLMTDLDSAAKRGGPGAIELQAARDVYRRHSEAIDALDKSLLHNLVGTNNGEIMVEDIAGKLLKKGMSGSGIRMVMDRLDPEDADAVRRFFIQDMFESAKGGASKPSDVRATPSGIVNWVNKHEDKLKAMFPRGDFYQFRNASLYLARVADRANMFGSQTAPFEQAVEVYGNIASPSKAVGWILKMIDNRTIAKAMSSREGREAILTVKKTRPGTQAFEGAVGYLTGLLAVGEQP